MRPSRVLMMLAIAGLSVPALAQTPLPVQGGQAAPTAPREELNTINDIFAAIYACWKPPPAEVARPGMEITFQVTFKRDGSIFGKPRINYETPGATSDQRQAYRQAVAEALMRCAPLPFSASLGNAIAGRPLMMRLIDTRQQQHT